MFTTRRKQLQIQQPIRFLNPPPSSSRHRNQRRKKGRRKINDVLVGIFIVFVIVYLLSLYQHTATYYNDQGSNNNQILIIDKNSNNNNNNHHHNEETKSIQHYTPNDQPIDNNPSPQEDHPLPEWVTNYIKWHNEMRAKYPGKEIIENPNAPKTLTRICLGLCGGLHDRLGQLPLDLYLANQTQRVLLIKWQKPQPLEEFLIPPSYSSLPSKTGWSLDWTFPKNIEGWGTNCISLNDCARQVRNQPFLPGNVQNHKNFGGPEKYVELIENDIEMLNSGSFKDTKDVTFTILGHLSEDYLERKLKELGETDMIHNTPTFGNIFHTFFVPHPNIQREIDSVSNKLGLVENEYTIAHCRVRHPKAYAKGETFNGEFIANADKTGLPFEGRFKDSALNIATRSIKCAAKELPYDVDQHPIYFMSDSSDLVTYFAHNLTDSKFVSSHPEWFQAQTSANYTAKELLSHYNVVARDQNIQNAHIDKNKGRPPEAYYATFVDLYLGIRARCVSFGIGCYAMFAMKISNTHCKIRYAREEWGDYETNTKSTVPMCTLSQ